VIGIIQLLREASAALVEGYEESPETYRRRTGQCPDGYVADKDRDDKCIRVSKKDQAADRRERKSRKRTFHRNHRPKPITDFSSPV
jgi:hypothetical protein